MTRRIALRSARTRGNRRHGPPAGSSAGRPGDRTARRTGRLRLLLVAILAPYYACGLGSDERVHGDETFWTIAGYRVARHLLVEGDISSRFWMLQRDNPVFTGEVIAFSANVTRNPKLGMLLLGAPAVLFDAPEPSGRLYRYDRPPEWNRRYGTVPPRATLLAARLPVAALGLAAAVWLFGLIATLVGPGWAFAGALLLGCNPLVQLTSQRAMLDGPAYALSIGAVLWSVRACQRPERLAPYLLTGALAGAAVSCKLNAGVLLPTLGAVFLIEAARRRSPGPLLRAAGGGGVALALFLASNPTLYREPVAGILSMLRLGSDVASLRHELPAFALPDVASRAHAAYGFLLDRYGMLGAHLGAPVDGPVLLVGLGALLWRARTAAPARVLLLWLAVTTASLVLWPPMRFERYFLPGVAPLTAAESVGIAAACGALARGAADRWHRRD